MYGMLMYVLPGTVLALYSTVASVSILYSKVRGGMVLWYY